MVLMPNHCSNQLTVSGPRSRVFDFCRDHYRRPQAWETPETVEEHKTVLDFSLCAPYPKGIRVGDGWYDWRIEAWGTKWNAYDLSPLTFPEVIESVFVDETTDTAQITYSFSTAWSPPTRWQEAASSAYPDLTFALGWEEASCDFWGAQVLQDNDILNLVEGACSDFCPEDVDWDDVDASEQAWITQTEETWEKIQEIMEEGLTSA